MAYYDQGAGALVFETAITGTHSAGKTTTIDMLRDPEITAWCELEEPYGISLVPAELQNYAGETHEQLVPLLTVSEASRHIAETQGDPSLLGEKYNASVQHHIDLMASAYIQQGRTQLARSFDVLRASTVGVHLANLGIILGDRGYLDGEVYGTERLSNRDQGCIGDFPVHRFMRFQNLTTVDQVFIADATEVPFEQQVARPDDLALRSRVQEQITEKYGLFSVNQPHVLQGSPEERRDQVRATLNFMMTTPFVAQNALTAYLQHRADL